MMLRSFQSCIMVARIGMAMSMNSSSMKKPGLSILIVRFWKIASYSQIRATDCFEALSLSTKELPNGVSVVILDVDANIV